jgi:tryptophanyl-tRNA synthetase
LEDVKDPATCNVFKLYELVADKEGIERMRENYLAGGFGYGHAKTELLNTILTRYGKNREIYNSLMDNKAELDTILEAGAKKARSVAQVVLKRVREKVGFTTNI